MSGVIMSLDQLRFQVAEFSEPLYLDEGNVFYARPKFESNLAGFVLPYSTQVS